MIEGKICCDYLKEGMQRHPEGIFLDSNKILLDPPQDGFYAESITGLTGSSAMKKSLGRGLSQLMQESAQDKGMSDSPDTQSSVVPNPDSRPSGVSRLMKGRDQSPGLGAAVLADDNPFHAEAERRTEFSVRRVPDWIFYLGDVVLLSAVVWMVVLSPTAPTWVEWATCLLMTVVAALLGIYPWARNVLKHDTVLDGDEVPQWSLAHKTLPDGSEKVYVIHLHEPFTAVEITETSWSGVQPKPIWLSGAPDISPEDMKRLLLGAADFYKQETSKSTRSNSAVSAA